jgi:hypothetical protein
MHRYQALATRDLAKAKICETVVFTGIRDLISIGFPSLMREISPKRKAAPVCSGAAFSLDG